MFNALTAIAWSPPFSPVPFTAGASWDPGICNGSAWIKTDPVPSNDPLATCPYVDPNPVESINGQGHNYFRSSNPYKLRSQALFGEAYWHIRDDLKLTAGLRYTQARKTYSEIGKASCRERVWRYGEIS